MTDEHLKETVLSDKLLYDGHIVHLHIKTVRLPDGRESKREIVEHSGAVAVVPVFPDGQVILVRQFRLPAEQVLLEIPAGTLEPNENPDDAVIREMQEETGYRPGKIERMGGIFVAPGYTTEYIHLYLARDLKKDALVMDEDEFIDAVIMPLDVAIAKIFDGGIQDGKSASALLMAKHKLSS